MHGEPIELRQLIVFLFAAGLVVPIAQRFRISPVLGFLLIGLLIGPYGAGALAGKIEWLSFIAIGETAEVSLLAELGVVLLLFVIGLELSIKRLWSLRRFVFGLGAAQVLITTAAIGAILKAFGLSLPTALLLGSCLSLSSTAIVLQLLTEGHRIGSPTGRTAFSILLLQDLAVVPILFVVGLLRTGEAVTLATLAITLGEAVLAIVAIMVAGRLIIRPLFRLVGATRSRELFMATVLLTAMATAMVTAAAGLSMALGAFLAGLLLADTEYRHQIEVDIDPFKGLLLGVFFVSVGLGIDPTVVMGEPLGVLAAVAGLFLLKASIIVALALLFRLNVAVALETGLLLGQTGEFAFVVIDLARGSPLLSENLAHLVLAGTGLSMMATPFAAAAAQRIGRHLQRQADTRDMGNETSTDLDHHIIIAGYGRVGRAIGALLAAEGVPYVAIDSDSRTIARYRESDAGVYFGDASRREILELLGIERALAMVVTMDDSGAAERIVATVARDWPQLPIFARARDTAHALRLVGAGARKVVPETVEASLQLGEAVLIGVGLPAEAARITVENRRRDEERRLGA